MSPFLPLPSLRWRRQDSVAPPESPVEFGQQRKTSPGLVFFIFALNDFVSGLIVKQILQEAVTQAVSDSPRAWGSATSRFCPGHQLPRSGLPWSCTFGKGV